MKIKKPEFLIAYVEDPNTSTFVIFLNVKGKDVVLAEKATHRLAEQWIKDNFIKLKTTDDYDLYKPTRFLNN